MRLRTLSEAECYARCYGGSTDGSVSVVRVRPPETKRPTNAGERIRELFEERLDLRGIEDEAA